MSEQPTSDEIQVAPLQEQNPGMVIGPNQKEIDELNSTAAQERLTWRDVARSKLGRAVAAATLLVTLPGIGHRGETHTEDVTTVTPISTVHEVSGQFTEHVDLGYQRDFETDASDAEQAVQAVEQIVEEHSEVFAEPGNITSITVEGSASADNNDAPGEFQDRNEDNEELAEDRGDLTALAVGGVTHEQTGVDLTDRIQIVEGSSERPLEHQWSDEVLRAGNELSVQFGYGADATEMVTYFEQNPDKVADAPPAVEEFVLQNIIAEQGADVTVEHSQDLTLPGLSVKTEKKQVTTDATVLTDAHPEGFMPVQPIVSVPEQRSFDHKIDKKPLRGAPTGKELFNAQPKKGGWTHNALGGHARK